MVRNRSIALSLCLFASACTFTPAPPGPGAQQNIAENFRVSESLEFRDAVPENNELILKKIEEFERAQNRQCQDIQFLGYDFNGNDTALAQAKVKASAMSSCGPSYYWFKKSEVAGRIANIEIQPRSPSRGDRILVRGRYGMWEVSRKY